MVFGSNDFREPSAANRAGQYNGDDYGFEGYNNEFMGPDSSGMSLDGKSLIVPDYGDVDDMSSIGTSKYAYQVEGDNEKGRSSKSSLERKLSRVEKDPEIQNEKEEKKYEGEDEERSSCCVPRWIARAPLWLKLIIVTSIALLLGAVVLIAVGAKLSVSSLNQTQKSEGTINPPPVDVAPQIEVSPPKTELIVPETSDPTKTPTIAPIKPTPPPVPAVTSSPTTRPTALPTAAPTNATVTIVPTIAPSSAPTQTPTSSAINFFVMGGRLDGQNGANLANRLQMLTNISGNAVLFHTGDWNSPYATGCSEESFIANVEVFKQSSVPVYFVPGDNEFNDCPNATAAKGFWNDYLLEFETKYWPQPPWNIMRQAPEYSENFAFLQQQILFVGINLVGGIVHDQQEWDARHAANLQWINATAAEYTGNYTTMVVVAHADPTIAINANFFRGFYPMVESFDERVIYVHRNLGANTWGSETGVNGVRNLDMVTIQGSIWPPLWMQIDPINGNYTIDQSTWYNEFIATGTMPSTPP